MSGAVRAWWPAIVWMAVIGILTSVPLPEIQWGGAGTSVGGLDKLAHFLLYLALGVLLGRGLWLLDRASVVPVVTALAVGLAFAAVDEWHQSLLSFRDAALSDWLADAAGVSLGLSVYLWRRLARRGKAVRAE